MEYRATSSQTDVIAPDGSEIALLSTSLDGGSMVLCSLKPGAITRPVRHRTVEEMWYVLEGRGRLWRSIENAESAVDLVPGASATIPLGARFQFRNDGDSLLRIVIATMPPWPGPDEAIPVEGPWEPSV